MKALERCTPFPKQLVLHFGSFYREDNGELEIISAVPVLLLQAPKTLIISMNSLLVY